MEIRLGHGVFSTKKYTSGSTLRYLIDNIVSKPTKESIRIGFNKHVIDKYGSYINHSFTPTTRIENNRLLAIKDIEIGEEITFNYNESEVKMACPFYVDGIEVSGKKN